MCGIVGYIGSNNAVDFLIKGLSKLEYRGYDSAGIAVLGENKKLDVQKAVGKLVNLENKIDGKEIYGTIGIGHTRWATHGKPSDANSHPHTNMVGSVAVVHNGIIENYLELRNELESEGICFTSETDTEVLPHLASKLYNGDLITTVWEVEKKLRGSYAAVFLSDKEPDKIVAVRRDNPLIVGIGDNEYFFASDIPALMGYCNEYMVLEDGETAVLTYGGVTIYKNEKSIGKISKTMDKNTCSAEKGGYDHFMLKEIHEQPGVILDLITSLSSEDRSKVDLSGINLPDDKIKSINKIVSVACGTAYHAGLVGKYAVEKLVGIPYEADIASEFRYCDPIIDENTLVIILSQSGETADTLAALREAKRKGCHIVAITNVEGSSIAREADSVIHTRAGFEIAVASTKAYSTQLLSIYMLALHIAKVRGSMTDAQIQDILVEINKLPEKVYKIINEMSKQLQALSGEISKHENAFFIGRGLDYAVALEGALKLKEISYIHAEAYAAGELKHGTIALIADQIPVIAVCTQRNVIGKTISNIVEVKARDAYVIAVAFNDDNGVSKVCDRVFYIPETLDLLAPILTVIPLQLIAYYTSVDRGVDVDQPRNLAKSVTVE